MRRGTVRSVAAGATAIAAIAVLLTAGSAVGAGRAAAQRLTLYTTAVHETFVGNLDDETRGNVSNPFGTHKRAAAIGTEQNDGPFPGDEALFSFDVYTSSTLKASTGSAVYTCWYYFNKNAFCDVFFQLGGSDSLIGAGTLNFNAKTFALAITGGTGKYARATGDVEATPSGKHAQRLSFVLG